MPPSLPTILLVEDDDAVRRSLQLLLRSSGFGVRSYSSGVGLADDPEALRSNCLISDLMMPQVGAIALLEDLRAAGWVGKTIVISGFMDRGWEKKARDTGYDLVLSKPISDSVLVRAVTDLMRA